MKGNKKLNKGLSISILVCLLAAFILSVVAKMYDNNIDHYQHLTTSTRVAPNWAIYAPFMVLCAIAAGLEIFKFVRIIKVNKSNLGKNKPLIAAVVFECLIIVLAILACISFVMWTKIVDINDSQAADWMAGKFKLIPSIVISAIGFAFAGVDCGLSFAKVDK